MIGDLNDFIKVITCVRKSGKSTLLLIFKDYLLNNEIAEKNIIHINFELQFTLLGVDKMRILPKKLIDAGCGKEYDEGYRIVYFEKDNKYSLGTYCKTIEGFMIDFADCDPIIDEDDIPSFTSVDDILNRSLNLYDDVI